MNSTGAPPPVPVSMAEARALAKLETGSKDSLRRELREACAARGTPMNELAESKLRTLTKRALVGRLMAAQVPADDSTDPGQGGLELDEEERTQVEESAAMGQRLRAHRKRRRRKTRSRRSCHSQAPAILAIPATARNRRFLVCKYPC